MEVLKIASADAFYVLSTGGENSVDLRSKFFVPLVTGELICGPGIQSWIIIHGRRLDARDEVIGLRGV